MSARDWLVTGVTVFALVVVFIAARHRGRTLFGMRDDLERWWREHGPDAGGSA